MAKMIYVVNGEEVNTLKEVAGILGVSRVSKADIESGKYDVEVKDAEEAIVDLSTAEEEEVEVAEEAAEETTEEIQEEAEAAEEGAEDWEEGYPVKAEEEEEVDEEDEEIEFPEVGDFEDVNSMKKYIKGLTTEQLQAWCELEGAEWVVNEHPSINRMRMAVAIKSVHFPETAPKKGTKKKSKYAEYTTEELVQMALDNDVHVRDDKGNERILRMYTIVALREAGLIS